MSDEKQEGLFGDSLIASHAAQADQQAQTEQMRALLDGMDGPGPYLVAMAHSCSKCGTGYATKECKDEARRIANLQEALTAEPGAIVRVGPKNLPQPVDWDGEAIVHNLLARVIGEDPKREGLRETPKRVVKAWRHWTSGYKVDIGGLLKTFEDGAENCDEMVVRKNIRIYSHCEHHLAPIIGHCTIAYIPNGRVVGLSKLDRLADAFARRLQVQERLTNQIADALVDHLNPLGVGVYINARHMCIESRGVAQHNSDTVTSALRGAIKDQPAARAEFLALARS